MPRKKAPVPRPKHIKPHDLIIRKLRIPPTEAEKRELEQRDRVLEKVNRR